MAGAEEGVEVGRVYVRCPFCYGDKVEGAEVVSCLSCGTRWDRFGEQRIIRTLEFDGTGKKWWWNDVDEGLLVVKYDGVVNGKNTILEVEVP